MAEEEKDKISPDEEEELEELEEEELDNEQATITEEEAMAEQIAIEQGFTNAQNRLIEIQNQGLKYKHPSYFKYAVLFPLAGINDLLDLLELTGFLAIFSWFASQGISMVIFLIFWFTKTNYVNAQEYRNRALEGIEDINKTVALLTRRSITISKWASKFGGIKRNPIPRLLVKARRKLRVATKTASNPLTKIILGDALEMIPIIDILPWSLISVFLSYRDEKSIYKDAYSIAQELETSE